MSSLSPKYLQPSYIPSSLHMDSGLEMNLAIHPLVIATLVIVPLLARHFYLDYKFFLSLGPGGTEQTPRGYMKLKFLSLFALRNPYEPPPLPLYLVTRTGYFKSTLPQRIGRRPQTKGLAPHRQMNQNSPQEVYKKFAAAIEEQATHCESLKVGTSCFEMNSTGLFHMNPQRQTCGGEVCHAHPSDGSMHLTLHPADAKMAIECGWAERHPLAKGGWMERFVPSGFLLVYAPRAEDEIKPIMEIVRAAAWWVAGHEVEFSNEVNGVTKGGSGEKSRPMVQDA
ncbi:hypothetical protein MBLNU457_5668t3 [Dothideomycetes sp. NU457]